MTMIANTQDCPDAIGAAGLEAVAAWEVFVAGGQYAPTTRTIYRSIAVRFLCWLEPQGVGLAQVTPSVVEAFLEAQAVASTTKYQYRQAIRRLFAALAARGVVLSNPAARVEPLADCTHGLAEQFARFSPIERQATVDAAAFALFMDAVHRFTEGAAGRPAHLDRCDETLRLGEQFGVTPLSWAEIPEAAAEAAIAGASQPNEPLP
jgi:hypothetical protein